MKYLSRINLFRHLDSEQLQRIEPVTPINQVRKGTIIAMPGMKEKRLFLVKTGTVRLYKLSAEGKELTVDLLGDGHVFGEIGSFATGSENLYAETMEDCVICSIDKAQFENIMIENPALALKFIEVISERLKEVEDLLEHMAYGSARKRLLYLLHKLSGKFGSDLPASERHSDDPGWVRLNVSLTHHELASMTGSIRETVTALLNEFAAEGIVKKTGLRNPLWIQTERLACALRECL